MVQKQIIVPFKQSSKSWHQLNITEPSVAYNGAGGTLHGRAEKHDTRAVHFKRARLLLQEDLYFYLSTKQQKGRKKKDFLKGVAPYDPYSFHHLHRSSQRCRPASVNTLPPSSGCRESTLSATALNEPSLWLTLAPIWFNRIIVGRLQQRRVNGVWLCYSPEWRSQLIIRNPF